MCFVVFLNCDSLLIIWSFWKLCLVIWLSWNPIQGCTRAIKVLSTELLSRGMFS